MRTVYKTKTDSETENKLTVARLKVGGRYN